MNREELKQEITQLFSGLGIIEASPSALDEVMGLIDKYKKSKSQTDFKEGEIELPLDKLDIFNLWMQYRRTIRKTIKAPETIKRLVKKFNEEPLDVITKTVNHSIENAYQGLFWDKFKTAKNGQSDNKTGQISAW